MSAHPLVPADVEADGIIDLIQDCREISGVLGPVLPLPARLPDARGGVGVEISHRTAAGLDGYGEYGS